MTEFHDIFVNSRIAYRGRGGQVVRVGGGKNPLLKYLWSSHDANRHPHNGPCHISRPQRHLVSSGRVIILADFEVYIMHVFSIQSVSKNV